MKFHCLISFIFHFKCVDEKSASVWWPGIEHCVNSYHLFCLNYCFNESIIIGVQFKMKTIIINDYLWSESSIKCCVTRRTNLLLQRQKCYTMDKCHQKRKIIWLLRQIHMKTFQMHNLCTQRLNFGDHSCPFTQKLHGLALSSYTKDTCVTQRTSFDIGLINFKIVIYSLILKCLECLEIYRKNILP